MASFNVVNLNGVMEEITRRTNKAVAKIPKMLEAGATVLIEAQKEEAKSLEVEDTGDFIASIGASKIKTEDGNQYIEVYPQGKDRKGVSNAEKGFIAEYGRTSDKYRTKPSKRKPSYKWSSLAPRPWMTAANEKSKDAVNEAMQKVWQEDDE